MKECHYEYETKVDYVTMQKSRLNTDVQCLEVLLKKKN